jgi:predicted flap endonuclease-1-like 5' DNA nuclease
MSPFLTGLLLILAGLAGLFWGYRIFRILLPFIGGLAGYLIAAALFPNNLLLALVIGLVLAVALAIFAYAAWSVMVTVSGAILGGSLGAAIAQGLNLWTWLGWLLIIVLAAVGAYLVWKIRDEVVIILTAIVGAAFVASGLRGWFAATASWTLLWAIIFIVLAVVGILWQWRRYRHLKLLAFGGPAAKPGATPAAEPVPTKPAPAVALAAPAVEAAAPAAAVVAGAAVVAASGADAETAAPAPEAEAAVAEPAAPALEVEAPAAVAAAAVAAGAATHQKQLAATLSPTELGFLQEKVEFIEGIGASYAAALNQAGIVSVMDLLQRGATRKGRADLVEATGIHAGLLLKWINHADLFRIKGVGKQFGELLEAAGVDTVMELAQRNPVNLFSKLAEVNAEKKLAGRSPHQDEVNNWVQQAKVLPRVVEY